MSNLDLAKEQGNQAAPNIIDAAKASEVQIDITLAQEQGNQAAPLIADSLASSESYDAIKQQGNQAMPLIVDALAGGGSDTGFELLDYIDQGSSPDEQIHVPFYGLESDMCFLAFYGILRDGYDLPNFTKLSIDGVEYNIYPALEQEPASAGCYLVMQQQMPIDSQEKADALKAVMGVDVKIGDTVVMMQFVLITEQVLSGDVPFTLHADQDSWSGTLHEYVDTSVGVYAGIDPNSDSTAYEMSVYTDNASNPYYKIGDDGEWTVYDSSNKPEFYLPGSYTIHLKATNNYDESETTAEFLVQIRTGVQFESHIVENPSAMFAGADVRVHLRSNYSNNELDGRDDVVFLYKEQSAATWESAAVTSTSDGYFAEVEFGWGAKSIVYKVQVDSVTPDETYYYGFDAVPMSPSFVDIIKDNDTYFARLRFGANYPDMNTVETIEYSFDQTTWLDATHDAESGYELAELAYDADGHLPYDLYIRTSISANSVVSSTVTIDLRDYIRLAQLGPSFSDVSAIKINNESIQYVAYMDVSRQVFVDIPFSVEVELEPGFTFTKYTFWYNSFDTGQNVVLAELNDNPSSFTIQSTSDVYNVQIDVATTSSTDRE